MIYLNKNSLTPAQKIDLDIAANFRNLIKTSDI